MAPTSKYSKHLVLPLAVTTLAPAQGDWGAADATRRSCELGPHGTKTLSTCPERLASATFISNGAEFFFHPLTKGDTIDKEYLES